MSSQLTELGGILIAVAGSSLPVWINWLDRKNSQTLGGGVGQIKYPVTLSKKGGLVGSVKLPVEPPAAKTPEKGQPGVATPWQPSPDLARILEDLRKKSASQPSPPETSPSPSQPKPPPPLGLPIDWKNFPPSPKTDSTGATAPAPAGKIETPAQVSVPAPTQHPVGKSGAGKTAKSGGGLLRFLALAPFLALWLFAFVQFAVLGKYLHYFDSDFTLNLMLIITLLVGLLLYTKVIATNAGRVFFLFGLIVVGFAGSASIHYRHQLGGNPDKIYLMGGLFLMMIAGMFVQVIAANYAKDQELFKVSAQQLIYPTLFSIIVYFGIWTVVSSNGVSLFSFYAAFLNGYFWESVVTSSKPLGQPSPAKSQA
jgi:hypothetical protein